MSAVHLWQYCLQQREAPAMRFPRFLRPVAALFVVASMASAQEAKGDSMIPIIVTVTAGETVLTAKLDDTPAGARFREPDPLGLTL